MRAIVAGPDRWVLPAVALLGATAEWVRRPSPLWVAVMVTLGVLVLILGGRGSGLGTWARRGGVALLLVLAIGGSWQLELVARRWPVQREALVGAASERLGAELRTAGVVMTTALDRAAAACEGTRADAFPVLARALPAGRTDLALTLLQEDGSAWAWAGRNPSVPDAKGDSLGIEASPHHLALMVRRPCAHGRQAIAQLLVWAAPTDPSFPTSLVERFRQETDVALRVWPGDSAPDSPDVFDYQYDTPKGTSTLFSLEALPPEQGERFALLQGRSAEEVFLATALLVLIVFITAGSGAPRVITAIAAAWILARAPLGGGTLWSEATFFRDFLGPFSASAGALLVTGAVGTALAVALWERRPKRTPFGLSVAALLTLGAPYLVSSLARGITPPTDGVPLGLWLSWQFALVAAAGALVALAAALTRGEGDPTKVPWTWWLGIGFAIAGAGLGLSVWSPRGGWPDWYPLPWAAALVLLLWRPAPRWAAVVGLGLVAGSAAALSTWGAELEGRLQVARRDVQRLGGEVEPLAVPRLLRLATLADSAPPADAAELYALWRRSSAGGEDYPALLALWGTDGRERGELLLDSVDAPPPLLAALIRDLPLEEHRRIIPLTRVPGTHLALLQRIDSTRVLVAVLGPRTQLVSPATLSRLLEAPPRGAPLYELALGTPEPAAASDSTPFRWDRNGWEVIGERHLELPGGTRHVHARVDLGQPGRLFVRGALVLAADAAFLALLWLLGGAMVGAPGPRPRWRHLARAFRVRLAVALTAFFVVPAIGFAVWTFARTREDAGRRRDLLLAQTLRGAQPLTTNLAPSDAGDGRLAEVTRGTGAEFGLYQGGRLRAVSHPVLSELGILPTLLPADAFLSLVLGDGLESMSDAPGSEGRTLRMGYRLVRSGGSADAAVLAAPRLSNDEALAREQEDLALVVLLAALLGAAASMIAAQFAARALARPVSDLRGAALAIGRGQPMPPMQGEPPAEFEPVFSGFSRMATDLAAGRSALEDARHRTAAVLATVATGVVAIDTSGKILLANGRARSWLGAGLVEGSDFFAALDAGWLPVGAAVRRALTGAAAAPLEIDAGERRYGAEVAGLGTEPGGVVLALTDLTDAAHTARVLAWGEMARQIAHEIKNPLTPLRLGVQHLRRVRSERPTEFDRTFDETSGRILAEIDRLDTVARAFSRFALPADAAAPLDTLELVATVREALALYRLDDGDGWLQIEGSGPVRVRARVDEMKEVLVNLVENARNAGAHRVVVRVDGARVTVTDDGAGIPAADLLRIFEPRFSTTTSGAGLGLSIVKRLVEGWGATIRATSVAGEGTTLTIDFQAG